MNRVFQAGLSLCALGLLITTAPLAAQEGPGRGNFDPEQFRARMMERYREALEVQNDDEWKLLEQRIEKVLTARRDLGGAGFFGRGFGGPRRENAGGGGGDGGQRRGARFGGAEASPEMEALQKAIDSKASSEELKAKLAAYRTARKEKQAKLDSAQEDLRKVLSLRQEASAVLMGLLD
jgi:hypothetical protein